MKKEKVALIFFVISISLFLIGFIPSQTGAVTGNRIIPFSIIQIMGFISLMISLLMILKRESLDYIVIPSGGGKWDHENKMYSEDKERAKKGLEYYNELESGRYFVISGYKGEGIGGIRKGQPYSIYKFLRKHGIKPDQMIVEGKSHNSLENVLYTLKKLKEKGDFNRPVKIAFVSYPDHLKRIEDFEKAASDRGLIGKGDFEFYGIPTSENLDEKAYENSPARRILHRYKIASINRYGSKKSGIKYIVKKDPAENFIKNAVKLAKKFLNK